MPESPHKLDMQPFPMISHGASPPTLWNIHYLNLDSLPLLEASSPKGLEWLQGHIDLAMSDREHADTNSQLNRDPLLNFKHNIAQTLLWSANQLQQKCQIFRFKEGGVVAGFQFIMFFHALRLDLPSHTVVVDAYVLPLVPQQAKALAAQEFLRDITALEDHAFIELTNKQLEAWKQLLPALVERCRTWKHRGTCKYLTAGTNFDENPLCGCGEGNVAPSFVESAWRKLSPFVTRLALGPLFAVSYLEKIGGHLYPVPPPVPVCRRCGVDKQELKLCGRCKRARYCSKTCQNEDWKSHKVQCKSV
jgi:hypothetical protein